MPWHTSPRPSDATAARRCMQAAARAVQRLGRGRGATRCVGGKTVGEQKRRRAARAATARGELHRVVTVVFQTPDLARDSVESHHFPNAESLNTDRATD